ncbi:globin [Sorangium cellulosum]|uniref:Globin n=2 Tax=Sorangium cellulosum TaxID=56 RepID=A0A150Q0D4_SORCE|nr:antibiotic biosynthesis monooxygenase family protein [Sorangium cellulosum]AGP41022.1 globin [Sorangium cellulosum So0157-2]KYF61206.1 globin [Sorangium cellulosum]KYG09624.1 globin [Sorangium cellulosum]
MIIEYIRYVIPADQEQAFLSAYRDAAAELRGSEHCLDYEISRCVEDPASFVVRIRWGSLEGHLQGFRKAASFPSFFAKVKPFYERIQEMRHYASTDIAGAGGGASG